MKTIEEKAKAYDEVREKIALRFGFNVAEEIFSEFEMSEDERVRKELVAFLEELSKLGKDTNFDRWKTSDCANWIAWLEKQSEISTKSVHIADIPFGAKDSELFEESITIPDGYYAHIDNNKVIIKRRDKSALEAIKEEKVDNVNKIEQKFQTLWHPADGDYLPETDRAVIVLTQKYPLEGNEYAVSFAHRPEESFIQYGKGGWSQPDVKWWLDCDLPK